MQLYLLLKRLRSTRSVCCVRSAAQLIALRRQPAAEAQVVTGLPSGSTAWREMADDKTNRAFYYSTRTGESCWYRPDDDAAVDDDDEEEDLGKPEYVPETDGTPLDGNESVAFSLWLNETLGADPVVGPGGISPLVPLSLEEDPPALVGAVRDGVLLCCLVNAVSPSALDLRALNLAGAHGPLVPGVPRAKRGGGHFFPCRENLRAALGAAAATSACLLPKHATAKAIEAGASPAIADTLWALLKLHVTRALREQQADAGSALVQKLALEGETAQDVARLSTERLVLRWVNFQLARTPGGCGLAGRIDAFGAQLADGVALAALCRTVAPEHSSDVPSTDSACRAAGAVEAVTQALSAAYGAGVNQWFTVEAMTEANARLQFAFLALLFAAAPALEAAARPPAPATVPASLDSSPLALLLPSPTAPTTRASRSARLAQQRVEEDVPAPTASSAAPLADEEREALAHDTTIVAHWINSLDIEGVCLRRVDRGLAVLRDLADGTVLLRVLDAIEPGIVQWSRANLGPRARKGLVENCNYVVNLGRAMDFGLSDVAGVDIVDSNAALVVPFLWQLMRYSTLRRLSEAERGAFTGFAPNEAQVLEWCNERVAAEATRLGVPDEQEVRVRSFGDSELCSGLYLLYLICSLRPGCVSWAHVSEGDTREEQFENALYLLSVARKLGAVTSCAWDDIVEVRPRAIFLLCAALVAAHDDALEQES